MTINHKKFGVLLIDGSKDSRDYFAKQFMKKEGYRTFLASNNKEIKAITQSVKRDDIAFIILNSNFKHEKFENVAQKLRNNTTTFLSEIILLASNVSEETKLLLNELNIREIFSPATAALKIISYLDKLKDEKKFEGVLQGLIYEFNFALKNKDIPKCEQIMENTKVQSYFQKSRKNSSLYGEYLFLKKSYQECYDFLKECIEKNSEKQSNYEELRILNCYAKCLNYLDKKEEAITIYTDLIKKSPKNHEHKINLSTLQISQAQWKEAIVTLNQIFKEDPKNKLALLNGSQAHLALGNTKEAENLINKIGGTIDSGPLVSFLNNQGVFFAKQNQYQKALEFYKNALFFESSDTKKIFNNIKICLMKLNSKDSVRKIIEEFNNLDHYKHINDCILPLHELLHEFEKRKL